MNPLRILENKKRIVPSGILISRKPWGLASMTFALIAACVQGSEPSLYYAPGSYLQGVNIGNIFFNNKYMYFKSQGLAQHVKASFAQTNDIPDERTCLMNGYDLKNGGDTDLACDTTRNSSDFWEYSNAAKFLYSALVPAGSFAQSCTGIMRTREGNTDYLYASCRQGINLVHLQNHSFYNRLNLTDCLNEEGGSVAENRDIVNKLGVLRCPENSVVKPKQILTGSYLDDDCSLVDTAYDASGEGKLSTTCGKENNLLVLKKAGQCLEGEKDIFVSNGELVCEESPGKRVELHTASQYLPAGNYLTTCIKVHFYPCLGGHGQGLLVAKCQSNGYGFKETRMVDNDPACRVTNLGYISNIDGDLKCDPSVTFMDVKPTQGSMLADQFRCNENDH